MLYCLRRNALPLTQMKLPVEPAGTLRRSQRMRELGAVAHQVDRLGKAEVLDEIVCLRHAINYRARIS